MPALSELHKGRVSARTSRVLVCCLSSLLGAFVGCFVLPLPQRALLGLVSHRRCPAATGDELWVTRPWRHPAMYTFDRSTKKSSPTKASDWEVATPTQPTQPLPGYQGAQLPHVSVLGGTAKQCERPQTLLCRNTAMPSGLKTGRGNSGTTHKSLLSKQDLNEQRHNWDFQLVA